MHTSHPVRAFFWKLRFEVIIKSLRAKALDLYETTFFTFAHIYNFSNISSTPDIKPPLSPPHPRTRIAHILTGHGVVYSTSVLSSQSNSCSHFRPSRTDKTWQSQWTANLIEGFCIHIGSSCGQFHLLVFLRFVKRTSSFS